MTHQEQMNFINHFIPLFQKESYKRGYSIISTPIAQTIIEGNWGRSTLAKYHNHWGLKCGSSWKGQSINLKTKEEYTPGTLTTIKDNFRVYNSDEEGVKGYYDFISTKRYANLKLAKNYYEYANMLKQDGYATSSTYVKTLVDTVNKFNLFKYDREPDVIVYPGLMKRSTKSTVGVVVLQGLLNNIIKAGLAMDGIYGLKTENAVRLFQETRNLKVDGIVGPITWSAIVKEIQELQKDGK